MDKNFSIYLLSNSSTDTYPNNTLTNFKTKLPSQLTFNEGERWGVAVEAIGISTDFKNITLPEKKNSPSLIIPTNKNLNIEDLEKSYDSNSYVAPIFDVLQNEKDFGRDFFFIFFRDKYYTYDNLYYELFSQIKRPKSTWEYGQKRIIDLFSILKSDLIIIHYNTIKDFQIKLFPKGMLTTQAGIDNLITVENAGVKQFRYLDGAGHYAFAPYGLKIIIYNGELYCAYWNRKNRYFLQANFGTIDKRKFPDLIKVKSKNIKQQIHNSSFSNDLLIFCPDFKEKEKYFFHEFETKQYVELNNSIITTFDIKLVDENNSFLHLLPGPASIVKLNIKKMDYYDRSFNIRLSSEKSELYKSNTNSNFKVKLPSLLNLNKDWKVCLTSINMPTTFKTLPTDKTKREIVFWDNVNDYIITIPEILPNITNLIQLINSYQFLHFYVEKIGDASYLKVHIKKKGKLKIHQSLAQMLGFQTLYLENETHILDTNNDTIFQRDNYNYWIYQCTNPINFELSKPNYIMVYSNIVEGSIVGNKICNILKIVPTKNHEDNYVLNEFKHNEFYDLHNTDIDEIEITLRSHDGEIINFLSNQNVIINLLFSNYV